MNSDSIGFLCLLSAVIVSLGTISQIRCSLQRRSTNGLSLLDSEVRVYGKLPWILYSFCLTVIDPWILSISVFNIVLNLFVLGQFIFYATRKRTELILRTALASVAFAASLSLGIFYGETLYANSLILTWLPLVSTIFLLPLATRSQFSLNRHGNGLSAVPLSRYGAYFFANFLSLTYGMTKALEMGWNDSWTICAVAVYGMALNGILMGQVLSRRIHIDGAVLPARA